MAIEIAGPKGPIGQVQVQQNVTGGYMSDLRPNVSNVGSGMLALAKGSAQLAKSLAVVDKKAQQDRDEATLLDIQNIWTKMKNDRKRNWTNPNDDNNGLGLNASKNWAEKEDRWANDSLNKFRTGKFQGAGGKTEANDVAALNTAISGLSPDGQLALGKWIASQTGAYSANVTSFQMQQANAARARMNEETYNLKIDQLKTADNADTYGVTIREALEAKNGQNHALGYVSGDKTEATFNKYQPQTMVDITAAHNQALPDVINGMLLAGNIDGAEEMLKNYGSFELEKGNEKSRVSLNKNVENVLLKNIVAMRIDTSVFTQADTIATNSEYKATDGTLDLTKTTAFTKELIGKDMQYYNSKTMKWDTVTLVNGETRKWTEDDVRNLNTEIKRRDAVLNEGLTAKREDILKVLKKKIDEDPTRKITSADTNGLSMGQIMQIKNYQMTVLNEGSDAPLVTNTTKLANEWVKLDPTQKAAMTFSEFRTKVIPHIQANERDAYWEQWATARDRNAADVEAMKLSNAKAVENLANEMVTDNKATFKALLANHKALVVPSSGNKTTQAQNDLLFSFFEIAANREFAERTNANGGKVLNFEQMTEIIRNLQIRIGGSQEDLSIDYGAMFNEFADLEKGISIATLIADPIQSPTTDFQRSIARVQTQLQNIPVENRFEVVSLYAAMASAKSLRPNLNDLASFSNTFSQLVSQQAGNDDSFIGKAYTKEAERRGLGAKKLSELPSMQDRINAVTKMMNISMQNTSIVTATGGRAEVRPNNTGFAIRNWLNTNTMLMTSFEKEE
jgi:hypothetical protein